MRAFVSLRNEQQVLTEGESKSRPLIRLAGYIDAATSMSESCGGGGGSTPESDWGKKDNEDERMFARRCLQMAHSICKPKPRQRGYHR